MTSLFARFHLFFYISVLLSVYKAQRGHYSPHSTIIDNDIFISNFEKKADIFNEYFANQCTRNDDDSILPRFVVKTDALLSHVSVTREHIINIINNFCPNKAHGYDGISVSMLKFWHISRFLEVRERPTHSQKYNRQIKSN